MDLDAETVQLLVRHCDRQGLEKTEWGELHLDDGFVFTQGNGLRIDPSHVSRRFREIAAQVGLPHIRFHDLRHSHASIANEAEVPITVVSERLGHSSPWFTWKVYWHLVDGAQEEAARRVAEAIPIFVTANSSDALAGPGRPTDLNNAGERRSRYGRAILENGGAKVLKAYAQSGDATSTSLEKATMQNPTSRPTTRTGTVLVLSMIAAGTVALLLVTQQSEAAPGEQPDPASVLPTDEPHRGQGIGSEWIETGEFEIVKPPVGDKLGLLPPGMEVRARAVMGRSDPSAMNDLAAAGAQHRAWPGDEVHVKGNSESLRRLLANGVVTAIQPDYSPTSYAISEGLGIVGAGDWHAEGHRGQGVKVAVIDTSFYGYESMIGGELPGSLFIKSFRTDGSMGPGNQHGTAVAEIVHDLAPQAELHLVVIEGESDMADAVDYVLAAGIDVVNTSLGWTEGPFDGSSPVAQEVARATAAGVTWVTAAGNEAMNHWGGEYLDVDADDFAEFDPNVEFNFFDVPPWGIFYADLNWATSNADLDMCLWELIATGPELVDCAAGVQLPGDRPLETLGWMNNTPNWAVYGVSVHLYSGPPNRVDLYVTGEVNRIDFHRQWRSLSSPGDVPSAITVGAVPWNDPTTIQPFSSNGPNALGHMKPDFVAPDMVSTLSYGSSGFPGTSAATPHVAGLAALLVEQNPDASPAEITNLLRDQAVPLPAAGSAKNQTFGWGLAQIGPVPIPPPPPSPCPDATDCDELVMIDAGSQLHLYSEISTSADISNFWYGAPADTPLMGDWDCDGTATPGMFRPSNGFAYLRNSNTTGVADVEFFYGIAGDIPIVGDWDNDGCDTLGIYRNGQVFIKNTLGTGFADFDYWYGVPGDRPFTGDFDGDGVDTVGLYRESTGFVYFRNSLDFGVADFDFFYGVPSDRILAGDWNGDGDDTVAVYRPSTGLVYFRMTNTQGFADYELDVGTNYKDALAVR